MEEFVKSVLGHQTFLSYKRRQLAAKKKTTLNTIALYSR